MTKRKSTKRPAQVESARSLDAIADDIHKLDHKDVKNIIARGKLLLEAHTQCEHGQWHDWLDAEFGMSDTTAARYMGVAGLSVKFPTVGNLKVANNTLYAVIDQDDEALPAIIEELRKHTTTKRLTARSAERVIQIGIGRHTFGDYPDAALFMLAQLDWRVPTFCREKVVAALQARKPEDNEAAESIVNEIVKREMAKHYDNEENSDQEEAEQESDQEESDQEEAEKILNDPSPKLPAPTTSSGPQKLQSGTAWAEAGPFGDAVDTLHAFRTKQIGRLVGTRSPTKLREVSDLLLAVASAEEKATADTRLAS